MNPLHRSIVVLLTVATATIALAPAAHAQEPEQRDYVSDLPPLLEREMFFGNPEIAGGDLSPNGAYVSFRKPLDGVMNIWVKAIDEPFEAARPVTADTARPVRGYTWSQDGEMILYVQDKGGDENFRVYAVDPDAVPVEGSEVPPARDLTPYEDVRAQIVAVPENTPNTIVVGLNDRDPSLHDVYRIDIESGERELVRLNEEGVAGWTTDLEGTLRLATKIDEEGNTVVYRVEPDSLVSIYTCSPLESCGPIRFTPDGSKVYFLSNKGDVDLTGLYLMDPATGELELVERDPEGRVDFGSPVFSEESEELIATAYEDERTRIYPRDEAFERDLERARERFGDAEIGFRSQTENGRWWLVATSSDVEPSTTYVYDRESGDFELLYQTRPEIPVEHMASMEPVTYTARDGVEIPAFLTVPNGVEAEDLSAIVLPHGGPWARDTWGYSGMIQFLANRGYAVLQPNFRGSTGYGKEFLNLGNAEWGTGDMQHDITDGVRWMIDEGIADPDEVAIMGGSYGGYATLAGLAFTPDLYAAGVDIVGPSSIVTLLNSIPPYWKPIQAIFDVRVGDLDDPEDVERMKAQSPLHSAEQITAPLLVIQGANDPRVKKRESDQIVVTLRDLGREVEYMLAPDEGHGFANEDNSLAMFAKIEEFLAEHLGGRYQPDVPPEIAERLDTMMVDVDTLTIEELATGPAGETITEFDGSGVEPATLTYQQTVETQGQTIDVSAKRSISKTTFEGSEALLIVDSAETPAGTAVDSTWADPATLTPLKRTIHQGPATVEIVFDGTAVTGQIQAGPQTMPIDATGEATVFVKGGALETALGTLEMGAGETATLHLFDPLGGTVAPYRVEAAAVETVETPAGAFEAIRYELVNPDGETSTKVWIATETGRPVKMTEQLPAMMGGGTATAELAASD
ncbi:MAG: prolyl oligopeptidase family serine peptidase [Gemmatimonadota bacterium]|nr:prolyl oligopeptidase family serine peptidase [Gemmatimonadota bacterium]